MTDLFEGKKPRTFRKLTDTERLKINALLTLHLVKKPDGTVSYEGDWTDEKVAAEVGATDVVSGVKRYRTKNCGLLTKRGLSLKSGSAPDTDTLLSMMAEANGKIAVLEKENAAIWKTLSAISDAISKNMINRGSSK